MEQYFLIKSTGGLDSEGAKVRFLGRQLTRVGDCIYFDIDDGYLDKDFEYYNLSRCKPSNTTGTSDLKRVIDGDEPLDKDEHKRFR